MEWQAVVFALQIMMLTVGWMLFQKAKGELSAKAAEAPVLTEIKALQRSVKQLLLEMTEASHHTSARLEVQCAEARTLVTDLEERLERAQFLRGNLSTNQSPNQPVAPVLTVVETYEPKLREPTYASPTLSSREERKRLIYELADAGASAAAIARETEISEGEVETLLALRTPVRA